MPQTMSHLRVSAVLFVLACSGCNGCNKSAESKPADDVAKTEAPAKAKPDKTEAPKEKKANQGPKEPRFELGACDASLRIPKTYAVASDQTGTEPLRTVELGLASTDPAVLAKPAGITLSVFSKAKGVKTVEWLKKQGGAEPGKLELEGNKLFFQALGGKRDVVTLGCADKIVQVAVTFDAPDAQIRKDFSTLMATLKVGTTRLLAPKGACKPPATGCASPMLPLCSGAEWTCTTPK